MEQLRSLDFRYVLLDEVTLMRDFIDSAALLSDFYAAQGMKIVLSGTDSLGFWFALRQELYDRAKMIHTTFIPYREHSRQAAPEQARHLRDAEKCSLTGRRFGKLAGRYVLYLDENTCTEDGVSYRNAEEFLKELSAIRLRLEMVNPQGEEQAQTRLTM